ncbi:MAG: ABC-2 type transport system ATP-binding protein [Candidatus Krumholzibacteriia bacterium]|jgi:ABC-2 type transport system ATP-binding protein
MMGAGVSDETARISARQVGKWFGEVIAVNNCSLNVGTGVVGLLGANGAGKSTLFKMLAGLMEPSHGSVNVFGRNLRDEVGWYRRMGFCPESDALPSWMTGREFLSLMLRLMGYEKAEVNRRVEYWLDRFELTEAGNRRMGGYSKGMRQKIKLAQAMAHDPEVIFLDEPLNGMDPVSRKQSIELVQELGAQGRTVLVSSHILPEVESMTSQIILIDRGKVLAEGGVTDIRDKMPEHPTTVALVSDDVRRLAGFLIGQEHVLGVEIESAERVVVRTEHAISFYRALPNWVLENDLTVNEILTLDDSLEAVFQYLTER